MPVAVALGVPALSLVVLAPTAGAAPTEPTSYGGQTDTSIARLIAVDAVSPTDAWAVGEVELDGHQATLVEHWDGTAWQQVASPSPGAMFGSSLTGVTAVSADDVWAVGSYGAVSTGLRTLILHWNGTIWSKVPSPSPSATGDNVLSSLGAVAADDVWAVGWHTSSELDAVTMALHWDGAEWSEALSPNPSHRVSNMLSGVTGVSEQDVWAVGTFAPTAKKTSTLVARWNGKRWSRPLSPNPGTLTNELLSVSARAAKDVWAVGDYSSSAGEPVSLLMHWNGRRWARVPGPDLGGATSVLTGVSAEANQDAWAVGYVESDGVRQTLILHWDGVAWAQVTSPNPGLSSNTLHGVDASGPDSVWAVGSAFTTANEANRLITSWDGLEWHTY